MPAEIALAVVGLYTVIVFSKFFRRDKVGGRDGRDGFERQQKEEVDVRLTTQTNQ